MRIDQVLTNLVSNAVKYGQGNPVEIELGIELGSAVVRVIDHGIGIAPQQRNKIFERFERAVSAREYGGLGLGLWITRQIVEVSGGTIEVESEPLRGSVFTVRLPLQPEERAHT
jgi:signal transduction histidine kinase